MMIRIEKSLRRLTVYDGGREVLRCPIALGAQPVGPKQREGDGRTPEGRYFICLVKEAGKYGRSLGLSYPGTADAQLAFDEALPGRAAVFIRGLADQRHGRDAAFVEVVRHKLRMLNGHAEAQRLHVVHVGGIAVKAANDVVGALAGNSVAEYVQVAQLTLIVAATYPMQLVQINSIGHAEILERAQELAVDGFR